MLHGNTLIAGHSNEHQDAWQMVTNLFKWFRCPHPPKAFHISNLVGGKIFRNDSTHFKFGWKKKYFVMISTMSVKNDNSIHFIFIFRRNKEIKLHTFLSTNDGIPSLQREGGKFHFHRPSNFHFLNEKRFYFPFKRDHQTYPKDQWLKRKIIALFPR